MKNIYDKVFEVLIGGVSDEWESTSLFYNDVLLDEKEAIDQTCRFSYKTFDDCYKAIQEGKIKNAEVGKTLFFNRPQISISRTFPKEKYTMTQKSFKRVFVRTYFNLHENLSMEYLMKNLSAEDFISYAKEHNLLIFQSIN